MSDTTFYQKQKEILSKAYRLIVKYGLNQNRSCNATTFLGLPCSPMNRFAKRLDCIGALIRANNGMFPHYLVAMLGKDEQLFELQQTLVDYNDDPITTKEDILTLYERLWKKMP